MITIEFAKRFSKKWIDDWNAHDLESILSHYADDCIVKSPVALERLPHTNGIINGKENLRKYWSIGLESNPDLHFQMIDILIGINSITIYYRNISTGKDTMELMFFDSKMNVNKAIINYSI